jgi:hypothetical protein
MRNASKLQFNENLLVYYILVNTKILVRFKVIPKGGRLYKCFTTLLTLMSFITSMSSFMNYQMLSLHEHFLTMGTFIVFDTSVYS